MDMSFYVGAMGAANCTEKLSVISNNLANVNNTGFKPKTTVFSELINYNLNDSPDAVTELQAGAGMRVERTYTGFDVAPVVQTESEYDYAIMQPNAFFMLRDPQTNEITYTRNGHFYRAEMEDGFYLMTESGKLVLDQNQEPLQLEVKDVEKMQAEMEEDYEEEIKAMAEVYQMEVDKVKEMLPEKSVIQIKEDIAVKKAAEFVVNNAKEK